MSLSPRVIPPLALVVLVAACRGPAPSDPKPSPPDPPPWARDCYEAFDRMGDTPPEDRPPLAGAACFSWMVDENCRDAVASGSANLQPCVPRYCDDAIVPATIMMCMRLEEPEEHPMTPDDIPLAGATVVVGAAAEDMQLGGEEVDRLQRLWVEAYQDFHMVEGAARSRALAAFVDERFDEGDWVLMAAGIYAFANAR